MALTVGSAVLGAVTSINLATSLAHNIVTGTIHGTYIVTNKLLTYHNTQVKEVLEEYDLIAKLEVIEAMTKNINDEREFVKLSLEHLSSILKRIHCTLNDINSIIEYHNTKWFNSWRPLNYDDKLNELKKSITLLDKRYHMFINMMKI